MNENLEQIKTVNICPLNLGKMKVIEDYCKNKTLQFKLNLIQGICLAMSIYLNQNDNYNPPMELKKSFEYGNYLIEFGYISYDGNVWTYFLGRYSNE